MKNLVVILLTALTTLTSLTSQAQHVSSKNPALEHQWYRTSVQGDTLIIEYDEYGFYRAFFVPASDEKIRGMYNYAVVGFIFIRDNNCGETVGQYHMAPYKNQLFVSLLVDKCEFRKRVLTGTWEKLPYIRVEPRLVPQEVGSVRLDSLQ